jgi:1-acyl-sn-glycerol-3-phosphate acyltransferase
MTESRFTSYQAYARDHGVNLPLYVLVRAVLQPFFLLYFRLARHGREHGRVDGPLLVAANHRSFLDPFVIGATLPWRRPMQYVAKVELFERRWQGWVLSRLGAFPIRRGRSDEDAMTTARGILERGGAVCMFPEGTRIRNGSLGEPRRGVGRLALETGAKVLPVAVTGSEHCRRGFVIRPRKVKVRAGRAMTFPRGDRPSAAVAAEVTGRVWGSIGLQWEWLGGLPPLRTAAVIGAGSWGTAVAVLLARAGLEVQLGCRTREQTAEIAASGTNQRYLPEVELPPSVTATRAAEIELGAVDLVVLAVPARSVPAVVGSIGDRVAARSAVLSLSKGLVPSQGETPTEYVGRRLRSRGIAALGGPSHALEAVYGSAGLALATPDADLRRQLGEVFDAAGVLCERSADLTGTELAGIAKNVATLAASAAEPFGLNSAGAAAGLVWRECLAHARRHGADPATFAGLAGTGDFAATLLASASRNRRAGALLAQGLPVEAIEASVGQAIESLDAVPLLAANAVASGVESPGLAALDAVVAGRISPEDWAARLRRPGVLREAA